MTGLFPFYIAVFHDYTFGQYSLAQLSFFGSFIMSLQPQLAFDHVVVTCHKLKAGIDYVRRVFGVEIPLGGQHDFMGTHNAVMAVGDGIYFEVIAIDTSLPVPPYPRWFGLGNPLFEDRMKDQPILAHYVLRTPDIEATMAELSDELIEALGC